MVWSSPAELTPEQGASVFLWLPKEDWPIQVLADSAGHYEVVLPAGTLEAEASNSSGTCFTAERTTTAVLPCRRQSLDLHMARWLE